MNNYIAGSIANANAGNRDSFAFAADPSYQGSRDTLWRNVNGRVTWQAEAKNKVSLFVDAQDRCSCIDSRALTAREASADFRFPWKRLVTATYTAPITNRVLVEAGYAHKPEDWGTSLLKAWSSSSSSSASTTRPPASSIAARARIS